MNISIISGRLTKEPEVKTLSTGSTVLNYTVAVSRNDKNKTTDFIDCVAWGTTADNIGRYFHKGDVIIVLGKITTRDYEKDGKRYKVQELLTDRFEFPLSSGKSSNTAERKEEATESATDASDDLFGGLEF